MIHPIIEATELNALLCNEHERENIRVLDATCNTVIQGLTPYQAHQAKRIDKAVYFDIDDVADESAPLPHTVPDADTFARKISDMGIGNNHKIIVYDQSGMAFAAARVWWLFRLFGHDNVQILNGGLPAWEDNGLPLSRGIEAAPRAESQFESNLRPHLVKYINDVLTETEREECLILDARAPERFSGEKNEARDFVENGHIPSSKNVFFKDMIDPETGKLKPKHELEEYLKPFQGHKTITCSCGGGVTACILALALHVTGYKDASIYDGSWAEWGNKANQMPINRTA